VSRFVIKPAGKLEDLAGDQAIEPLADTGLFVADASDPKAVFAGGGIAWAAPVIGEGEDDSYPTGEVSVRFEPSVDAATIDSFVAKHSLELRSRNEFVPTQITVAPSEPSGTWLPDLVESLNEEPRVSRAWPNTLSTYRRG
jgi:hypothetical protein